MIIAQTLDRSQLVSPTIATFLEFGLDRVAAVHYKHWVDRETNFLRHKTVERHDDEKLKQDLKDKVQLLDEYESYRKQFMNMLTKLQFTWNGHLGKENIAKHCIERTVENTQPNRSAPYKAGAKPRELEKAEIDKMLLQLVIKPGQTECAVPIVFLPKKPDPFAFI